MKRLLILRHAKSSWADSSQDDWHRPLNERGQQDAPRVGKWLSERSVLPDVIITSDAVRARTTAQAVAKTARYTRDLIVEPALYLAKPDTILDVLRSVKDAESIVMIVGHNPGLEELVGQLTGDYLGLATAAIVDIELSIEHWSELDSTTTGSTVDGWQPR